MAQIFVFHSAKDKESVAFLSRAFASTQVRAVFEEFEAILKGPPNAQRIASNIRQSNAVFVLLGKHAEELKHTRDWIGWESGVASAALDTNKDIWVLEPITEAEDLTVVIPHLQHYVCFVPTDDSWQGYLTQIIESYDDSHILKVISAGAATGAAITATKDTAAGALWGAGAALVLATLSSQTKPCGTPFQCPKCWSSYSVHLCARRMRCPVCNSRWRFAEA